MPVFIMSLRRAGLNMISCLKTLRLSLNLSERVSFLYVLAILFSSPLRKALASRVPLVKAELKPSSELALINPAASPMRKTLSVPVTKSDRCLGLQTRQASVYSGSPKLIPINSSNLFFCSSKACLQLCNSKDPPNIT